MIDGMLIFACVMMMIMIMVLSFMMMEEGMEMSPPISLQCGGICKCRLTTSSFYLRSLLYEFP